MNVSRNAVETKCTSRSVLLGTMAVVLDIKCIFFRLDIYNNDNNNNNNNWTKEGITE